MRDVMPERVPQHAAGRSPKASEDCLNAMKRGPLVTD
jgi:hypothetical protein